MSAEQQPDSLREFLETLLEVASAKLAELNEPTGPEALTRVVIEFMSLEKQILKDVAEGNF